MVHDVAASRRLNLTINYTTMGQAIFCQSDEVSCSSAFATCRTQHCSSSCIRRVKAIEEALAPLEIIAQNAIKKYLEDNLGIILQDHLPAALATHLEAAASNIIDIVIPDVSPDLSPDLSPSVSPDALEVISE